MKFLILAITLTLTSCGLSQDPCVHLHDWNYTDEWYYRGDQRFQVYKTWTGTRFYYDLTPDSTAFKRYKID